MKPLLTLLLACCTCSFALGQVGNDRPSRDQLIREEPRPFNDRPGQEELEQIEEQLKLLDDDYKFDASVSSVYDTLLLNTHDFRPRDVPTYAPAIIRQRLYEIPSEISLDYNVHVQNFIDLYTLRRREQVSRMLGLQRVYFPVFEEELDKHGMPMELKYLSIVESALNPHARSRVGATGLWQFMYGTGKEYGLRIDSYVDERKDPYKSTVAGMKYLRNAYKEFGDWHLAIASYNCGAGNVRKAIVRSGGQRDFWAIIEYLPRETRGYVPAFIAATYVFNYASEHNIYPTYPDFSLKHDTLHLSHIDITLEEIAQMTNVSYNQLLHLNPELKMERIPYSPEPYVLRVPPQAAEYFAAHTSRIRQQYGERREPPKSSLASYTSNTATVTSQHSGAASASTGRNDNLVYYTVRSGDVVGAIADKYGVSAQQIADWNDLRRYRIKVGQKLKIYTRGGGTPVVTTTATRQIASAPPVASPSAATRPALQPANTAVYHTVKKGETLWAIAGQYPGVDVKTILGLNEGLDASRISVGQQIRVK